MPSASDHPLAGLARLGYRVLRITLSTIAAVSLLRQNWVASGAFAAAWLLVLRAPGFWPLLAEPRTEDDRDGSGSA